MASRRDDAKVQSVNAFVTECDTAVRPIRNGWREAYNVFVYGSTFREKQDWQTNISLNKLGAAIRAAHAELRSILVENPQWWDLECRAEDNQQAQSLRTALKKILSYYLDCGEFPKHASTFILAALLSMGTMVVGWKQRLVTNPKYVIEKGRKERNAEQRRLAKIVENPQVTTEDLSGVNVEDEISKALDQFSSMAQAQPAPAEVKEKPYIQAGCPDFQVPNHEHIYWDTTAPYLQDSERVAYKIYIRPWKYQQLYKQGYFDVPLKDIGPSRSESRTAMYRMMYANESQIAANDVELTVYFGPLVIDDMVKKEQWFGIVANGQTLVKDAEAVFWEPPGHKTPVIFTSVREIPWRATGAGLADSGAIRQQRTLDTLINLSVDQAKFGVIGLTVVKESSLVDRTLMEEGIEPGLLMGVRDDVEKAVKHVNVTSNIENTVSPLQATITQGIQDATGTNDIGMGRPNLRSRTSAAETNQQAQGASRSINAIATNLETNFLVPALEKTFARVLQFGLSEIQSNPELQQLLNEEELQGILSLQEDERLSILSQFYRFKVEGFSAQADKQDQLQRFNEYLDILLKNPVAMQVVNMPNLLRDYHKKMGLDNPDTYIVPGTETERIFSENQILLGGGMVLPGEQDNDELHLQMQGPLSQSPYATPMLQQHVMMHQQRLQQKQMAQQAMQQSQGAPGGQQGPPIQ